MSTVANMIERLQGLKLEAITTEVIESTADKLVEFNQVQMEEGKRADGERIEWLKDSHYPYTKPYEKRKAKLGLPVDKVDLKLSGAFYQQEKVKVDGEKMTFYNDGAFEVHYLETNYGKQILGLTDESKATYTKEYFFSPFKQRIEEATGLAIT